MKKVYCIKRKNKELWEVENMLYKFEIRNEDLYDMILEYFKHLFIMYDNTLIRYEVCTKKSHMAVGYEYIRSLNNIDEILSELLEYYYEINFYDVSDDKSMHDEASSLSLDKIGL